MKNKRLSIKTDERYLRLMVYDPECGKDRCACCQLKNGGPDCEQLKALCAPQGDSELSGLEFGGYFEDLPPREPRSNGSFHQNRGPRNFNGYGNRDRGGYNGNHDRGGYGGRDRRPRHFDKSERTDW